MRRRPQPNRRRGLLRAAVVVVVLTALLVAAILVVSTLLAPKATAPTVPPTAGPLTPAPITSITPGTPGTPQVTVVPQGTVRPTTQPTANTKPTTKAKTSATPKRDISLAPLKSVPRAEYSAAGILHRLAKQSGNASSTTPRRVAFFSGPGTAYSGRRLNVREAQTGITRSIGRADPFVRPVWSANYTSLLYVRVRQVTAIPGARWSLYRYDVRARRSARVVSVNALQAFPLGWLGGKPLFAAAYTSGTYLYTVSAGRAREYSILETQALSSATLSPTGRYIALAAPSSCSFCTVDMYDLSTFKTSYGPAGVLTEHDLAWTADGETVVARLGNFLVTIGTDARIHSRYTTPTGMPRVWPHSMAVRLLGRHILLEDAVTGQRFSSTALGS